MQTASSPIPAIDRNWALVAAGALMTGVAIGVVFSLAVFLDPMGADTGWSRAGISGAMTLAFLSMGFAGFGWGTLSDRYGPRRVVLTGVLLLGLATVLASRATSLLGFQLCFGLLTGVAAGAFFAPIISATAASFDKHRGLAVSLVSAGMGVAPMTIAPLAAWLVTEYGWRTAQLSIGLGAWALLLPAVWFVRAAPAQAAPLAGVAGAASAEADMSAGQALRSRAFIVLGAARAGGGTAGAGARGRVVPAGEPVERFLRVAIVFGAAYGGTMPLYASLAREAFGPRILGTVLGAATLLSSLGMALGPLLGGWLYDRFGSYTWLYIGSLFLGLAAAGIAATFPRGPAAGGGVRLQVAA